MARRESNVILRAAKDLCSGSASRLRHAALALLVAALLFVLFAPAPPTEAARIRKTPTPSPTADLRGYFRLSQTVQWEPSRVIAHMRAGEFANVDVVVRVSQPVPDAVLQISTFDGRVVNISEEPLPSTLQPGTDYEIRLQVVRPAHGRTQAAAYLQLKSGTRRLNPILQVGTRPPPGGR